MVIDLLVSLEFLSLKDVPSNVLLNLAVNRANNRANEWRSNIVTVTRNILASCLVTLRTVWYWKSVCISVAPVNDMNYVR